MHYRFGTDSPGIAVLHMTQAEIPVCSLLLGERDGWQTVNIENAMSSQTDVYILGGKREGYNPYQLFYCRKHFVNATAFCSACYLLLTNWSSVRLANRKALAATIGTYTNVHNIEHMVRNYFGFCFLWCYFQICMLCV